MPSDKHAFASTRSFVASTPTTESDRISGYLPCKSQLLKKGDQSMAEVDPEILKRAAENEEKIVKLQA
jgi:hypothetical protein